MRVKSPCLGCKERYIGCHSDCLKYIDYAQANEALRMKRNRIKFEHNLTRTLKRDGCEKARRRHP